MNRVVITGIGCVTPLGDTYEKVVNAMYAGQSGIAHSTLLNSPAAPAKETVTDSVRFDIDRHFDRYDLSVTDMFGRAAMLAYSKAKEDSGTSVDGLYIGSGAGASYELNKSILEFQEKNRVRPTSLIAATGNGAASFVALKENISGPVFTHSAACSSSSVSIGEAYKAIKHGEVDVMAAGGTEYCLSPLLVEQWRAMRALGTKSAPFSADRDGIVLGEGSVIYILENLNRALARGAKIYAEIIGYGISCGSETITKPCEDAQVAAIKSAIKGIDPARVTYINAHGTGTPVGDLVELGSIQKVFGSGVPISSTKAIHGHLLGCSGAMELIACLGVLNSNKIIPNWNFVNPDPEIPEGTNLPTSVIDYPQDVCLNNSFAFGGTNVVMALTKYEIVKALIADV
jgi:3-oxoacyl-[acyl-carrier-protein] synthase II